MTSFFCYGSLRHVPLLEIVLGRSFEGIETASATLKDHAVYWVKDQSFPMVVAETGASVAGLLINNLNETDMARLSFYEAGFEYDLSPVTVTSDDNQSTQALVFFPDATLWSQGARWSLVDWERAHGALSREAAHDVMRYFGRKAEEDIVTMFPMIRARATARLNARAGQRPRSPSGMSDANVRIIERVPAYADFFALDEYKLSYDRFDGTPSQTIERAVFLGGDGAFVLPYDPVRDRVLLVEQFRMGPLGRGDPDLWQLEPIAGRLDGGESPESAARREALEEAGLTLGKLETVAECYASSGATSEFFYIYMGLADLPDSLSGLGGLVNEAEDIKSHLIDFDELMTMTETFAAKNAGLVLSALWLARHRDRLRATK